MSQTFKKALKSTSSQECVVLVPRLKENEIRHHLYVKSAGASGDGPDMRRCKEMLLESDIKGPQTSMKILPKIRDSFVKLEKLELTNDSVVSESRANSKDCGSRKRNSVNSGNSQNKKPKLSSCPSCRESLDSKKLRFFEGHPDKALEETVALFHPSLLIQESRDGDSPLFDGDDFERPAYRLTSFSFYDSEGHLVPIDSGIIERNEDLFFSGYLKSLTDESPTIGEISGAVPVKACGPVVQWWATGYEPSENHIIGVTTSVADYYLLEPSDEYSSFFQKISRKIFLTKIVIEYLSEANLSGDRIEYEDLLSVAEGKLPKGVSAEDEFIEHSNFILSQVYSYEENGPDDEEKFMIDSPCMQNIMELTGLKKSKIQKESKSIPRIRSKNRFNKKTFIKATTTPLVRFVFESIFKDQLASNEDSEFNSTAEGSQEEYNSDENSNKENMINKEINKRKKQTKDSAIKSLKNRASCIKWSSECIGRKEGKRFYKEVAVDSTEYKVGDAAYISIGESTITLGKIEYLYERESDGKMYAHIQRFIKGNDTILLELADEREVFQEMHCYEIELKLIVGKATIVFWPFPEDWHERGGKEDILEPPVEKSNSNSFWYRMRYSPEYARFEHAFEPSENTSDLEHCNVCSTSFKQDKLRQTVLQANERLNDNCDEKGYFKFKSLELAGKRYRIGDGVFLAPAPIDANQISANKVRDEEELEKRKAEIDEDKYPEFYRKTATVKGSNECTSKPFDIGILEEILSVDKLGKKKIVVRIRKLYRPEDTCFNEREALSKDLCFLYWSEDIIKVPHHKIQGKCYLRSEASLCEPVEKWISKGEHRFYFNMCYDKEKRSFEELPPKAEKYGMHKQDKGKGLENKKSSDSLKTGAQDEVDKLCGEVPSVSRPLRCLDVFAGCGGLSLGLHQAEIAETLWAIEVYDSAAEAFKKNNPDSCVFKDDCNELLRLALEGKTHNSERLKLPSKGDVELLCGGPPCQGFSGMNRFNWREYSAFKNSLIATYLGFCDFYRPRYFILENVRNFVSFKKSQVLKMCMKSLLRMGYACTFGILQAGNFGVPQTRRRAILLAAAPGEVLPKYPEPRNVFSKTNLSAVIGDMLCVSNEEWKESAPYRTITVRDAMSDLPQIKSGEQNLIMDYECEPMTHFQRQMRKGCDILRDHICKAMSPLVDARMELIPTEPGSDWRDLPNIVMKLSDGSFCDKLHYRYHDKVRGVSSTGALRGVCICATGNKKQCNPEDKQGNTLIPWCLPHTSARHNQWAGLYGRLSWCGFFHTTVTNPEPMGKQGRVLHPEQHRVVSVRECARSQGFPDSYIFHGSILEKHRQVGNAVPPPMGYAIGIEIRKAVAAVENRRRN